MKFPSNGHCYRTTAWCCAWLLGALLVSFAGASDGEVAGPSNPPVSKQPAADEPSADTAASPAAESVDPPQLPAPEEAAPIGDGVGQSTPVEDSEGKDAAAADGSGAPASAPSPAASPADAATTESQQPTMLRFSFNYQPWPDVLRWFAEQNDLSMVLDTAPTGTFNYTDNRQYTPAEAIDLLNSVLLTKGYTLVRRDRMLFVINLEDGIPPNLVPNVPLEDLDKRGEFELVSVVFPLSKLSPAEAETEVGKLIGSPPGSVLALEKSRQVLVTDTAGRLRVIRSMLERIENPQGSGTGKLQAFEVKYVLPEEVLPAIRKLCGLPDDADAAEDGSLRLAVDPVNSRLLVTGEPDKVAQVEEILHAVDTAPPGQAEGAPVAAESPQLEVYAVDTADADSVLAVMQTLMEGLPDVRLAIDPRTSNLIALARPSQHATIRATLDQMQHERRTIEVIHLQTVDPQTAVLSINKLFSESGGGEGGASPGGPQVDADPIRGQLFVHGTQGQIAQIRSLLEKMGEVGDGGFAPSGNVRHLPLTGQNVEAALQRAREIWPTLRANPIRVVAPSAEIPAVRPSGPSEGRLPENIRQDSPTGQPPSTPAPLPAEPSPPPVDPEAGGEAPNAAPGPASTTRRLRRARIYFAADTAREEAEPAGEPGSPFQAEGPAAPRHAGGPPAIIVVPGPEGLLIASQDVAALDDFEKLLSTLAGGSSSIAPELTVFYLRHSKATVVAATLNQILSGGAAGIAATDGDFPGAMGGILGSMMVSGSSGISTVGTVTITPDARLNALIVQASPVDVALVEQLLKVLDQRESPEDVLAASKARMIPVFNTDAGEIAAIVKEVYQDRLIGGSGSRGNATNGPAQLVQAMRAMRGRGGQQNTPAEEAEKMSVGVDTRTNSLVVVAPDALFQEIKQLVEQLDQAAVVSNETVRVVTLGRASPAAVQQALSNLLGASVHSSSANEKSASGTSGRTTPQPAAGAVPPMMVPPFMRGFGGRPPGPGQGGAFGRPPGGGVPAGGRTRGSGQSGTGR